MVVNKQSTTVVNHNINVPAGGSQVFFVTGNRLKVTNALPSCYISFDDSPERISLINAILGYPVEFRFENGMYFRKVTLWSDLFPWIAGNAITFHTDTDYGEWLA